MRQALRAKEVAPGGGGSDNEEGDDEEQDSQLAAYVRDTANPSGYHPCCTAAMLPLSKGGMVNKELHV